MGGDVPCVDAQPAAIQSARRRAWATAYHESAHAVCAYAVGVRVHSIIVTTNPPSGTCFMHSTNVDTFSMAVIGCAGPLGESRMGCFGTMPGEPVEPYPNDFVCQLAGFPPTTRLHQSDGQLLDAAGQRRGEALLAAGDILDHRWGHVEAVAQELLEHEVVTGQQFEILMKSNAGQKSRRRQRK